MIVTVQRTGGFAGLTRSWQVDVEAEPDTESWLVLIDGLPWLSTPSTADGAQPDRFVWVIVVEAQPVREATLPEQQLTGPWRELVDRVRTVGSAVAPHADATSATGAGATSTTGAGAASGTGAGER
ncbi:protealysin inhibitor emfourin [Frigoribacterium sp. CFBP 13707]|uniref:protealysin inhibitor emfourin n=1 Tax=Frigoribacterium sp. CFBP 13707 TaxID=2775313 RepID=UPI00177C8748|nr:protealysin inhibitor emfourin [Frigoribacterium sp. CFBP 13707]MBD8728620.1 hypothetical protein [Frigoribacterium sp. CFBP 13707]